MPSHWEETTWGEAVELKYGKAIRGYQDANEAYPVFGTNGQVGTHAQYLAEGPGVILGRKGAYRGVHYSRQPFYVIDTAYYVSPKQDLDMRWLYYAMQHYKLGQIDDGSPIPSTTRAAVYSSEFKRPPIGEQRDIASCLGALDDKIELNRRMNETLEEMARALFRDWFVDFGPTRRQADGATDPVAIMGHAFPREKAVPLAPLFPTKLGNDGLPEGWTTEALGQRVTVKRGGSPRPIKDFIRPTGIPWVKIADATRCDGPNLFVTREFIKEEGLKKTVELQPGSLILSNSATPGLPKFLRLRACIHDGWLYFPDTGGLSNEFLYLAFMHFKDAIVSQATGSVFNNLKTEVLKRQEFVFPSKELLVGFDAMVRSLFNKILAIEQENQTLAEMRDLLLPKLMSGDMRLKDAEAQL